MTTTSRNGAAEITETSDSGKGLERGAGKVDSGENGNEKKGFSLFGDGPQSQEALTKRLESFLKDEPVGTGAQNGKGAKGNGTKKGTPADARAIGRSATDATSEAEETESDETHEASGDGEFEEVEGEEGEEGSAGASPHLEEDGEETAEGGETAEEEPKDWPKAAVREVSKLRKERREARESADGLRGEVEELRGRLESQELKRPVAPTKENPLSFATDEKALDEWEQTAGRFVGMMEDALESGPEELPSREVVSWAKENGAWDAENERVDRQKLRGMLREARTALTRHAPARRQFLAEQRVWEKKVSEDAVLGTVWKNKGSQEYRDAMGVLENVPGLRGLAHARAAAAVYALGLREYRKLAGAKAGNRGAPAGARAAALGESSSTRTLADARGSARTVKGPGRTVVVPRNPPAAKAEEAAIAERIRKPGATSKDWEAHIERQLAGKL